MARLFVGTALFATAAPAQDRFYQAPCDAAEVVGQQLYDELVCPGIAAFERGDYAEAIALFERALDTPLHEVPNYELLPQLAVAYASAGERAKAVATLAKAELAARVLTRMVLCLESENGGSQLVWSRDLQRLTSPYYEEISGRMCGAAYDSHYHHGDLKVIEHEAAFVQRYLEAKRIIEAGH